MVQAKTVNEFSIYASKQFIRTAVVIDDKIYENQSGKLSTPEGLQTPKRKSALKSPLNDVQLDDNVNIQDESEGFSWKDLINSFAKEHIVCSLYEPDRQSKYTADSDVYKLCLASDIVIVDWNLYDNLGLQALELITNLVHNSLEDIPEQLRLILVYTSEPNLRSIADKVFEALEKVLGEDIKPQFEDEGLSMHSSNSRIIILGKPRHRLPQYKSHEVPEKDLAKKSIEEFSKLASGLLQGAILLGLAKVRENSRKVLSKFGESIDAAFLLHRAMSLPHEEAFEHIHPLLVAEIQSILQDCLPGKIISDTLVSDWVLNKWKPNDQVIELHPLKIDANEFVKNLFLFGPDIGKRITQVPLKLARNKDSKWEWSIDSEKLTKLSKLLFKEDDKFSNHKLAILMSHRTSYGNVDKSLTLGTIIRKGTIEDPQYLLCLLPICDTVRLVEKRRFVFCILDVINEESPNKQKANHIIEDTNGFRELLYTPKSYNCVTLEFEPDSKTKMVIAKKDKNNILSFYCKSDRKRYTWIAQLKPEHAQRAAEQFSRDLSRVGLTESEWLRLMSK